MYTTVPLFDFISKGKNLWARSEDQVTSRGLKFKMLSNIKNQNKKIYSNVHNVHKLDNSCIPKGYWHMFLTFEFRE